MTEKKIVTIKTECDGLEKTYSVDRAILFTIDEAAGTKPGIKTFTTNIACLGRKIPLDILAEVLGEALCSVIENLNDKGPLEAAYNLSEMADVLEKRSNEIVATTPPEEIKKALDESLINLFKVLTN